MERNLVKISVLALVEDKELHSPAVILIDKKANRILPIVIGEAEKEEIAIVMQKLKLQRPTTHRLMEAIIKKLGGKLEKIVVNKIKKNTFYSLLYIQSGRKTIKIDARPSDAIVLALQKNLPVFVAKRVMDQLSQPNPFQTGAKIKFTKKEINYLATMLKIAREKEEGSEPGDS